MQHRGLRRKNRPKSNRGSEKELSIIFLVEINFKYPQIKARFMDWVFPIGRE